MRNIKRKVVYGKFGPEGDVNFLQGAIENSLKGNDETKKEIKQLWKEIYKLTKKIKILKEIPVQTERGKQYIHRLWAEIYQLRKRIEKELKPLLKEREETRKLYEKKIEEIRQRPKVAKKQNSD